MSQTEDERLLQETLPPHLHVVSRGLSEHRRPMEDENKLSHALQSTRSEHDEHADTIRASLKSPDLDVNRLVKWCLITPTTTLLNVACGSGIQSHVGAQLLLSDERCDVNLQNGGDTALMKAATLVNSEDDKHAKIVRLLLAHPRIDVNRQNWYGETALHKACAGFLRSSVGVQLLLTDERLDVNVPNERGDTVLMVMASICYSSALILKLLLQQDALYMNNLNKLNQSALMIILRKVCTAPEFSSPSDELDVIKLFLSHGADPNVPAHLLAWAVNFCSLDVCRELLQHGADPNSAFPNTEFSLDQHGCRETALHCAIRRNSLNKLKLLLDHQVNCNVLWQKMTIFEFAKQQSCRDEIFAMLVKHVITGDEELVHKIAHTLQEKPISTLRRVSSKLLLSDTFKCNKSEILSTLRNGISRMSEHQAEIRALEEALQDFVQAISDHLPEQFSHFSFKPILCGSMAEGTKCYQPDEFDFICELTSDALETDDMQIQSFDARFADLTANDGYIGILKFAARFYAAIDFTIKHSPQVNSKGLFRDLQVLSNSFLLQNKISRLRLAWNGQFFQRMNVYVDLVPAVYSYCEDEPNPFKVKPHRTLLISKTSRHDEACRNTYFDVSHSSVEQTVIASLPVNMKHGLILAKAVRLASIARPTEDVTSHYGLQEDIHVDDFITSYMLKTRLMQLLHRHSETEDCRYKERQARRWMACGWAIKIYEQLKKDLEAKKLGVWHTGIILMNCTYCEVEYGCCKKRKLTLAMTSQILRWLKRHKKDLNRIATLVSSHQHDRSAQNIS